MPRDCPECSVSKPKLLLEVGLAPTRPNSMAEQDTAWNRTWCALAFRGLSVLGMQMWEVPSHDKGVSPAVPEVLLGGIPHSSQAGWMSRPTPLCVQEA